ncbi:hypothetical protein MAR_016559 [Mya arenaria]|uniref:Uncharacterized protein n=1 Tax=Mya arenaria TaxID=6604 RepID=A0ABY7FK64_MYAAR|nr:hypothetical protein MAR_016559 [Mya arenaria]
MFTLYCKNIIVIFQTRRSTSSEDKLPSFVNIVNYSQAPSNDQGLYSCLIRIQKNPQSGRPHLLLML